MYNMCIDDYPKDGGTGEPLRNRIKTNLNKSGISNHTTLKLAVQTLRSYLN